MRYAIVKNGAVVNIAEADAPLAANWIADDGNARIGGTWDGSAFHPPAPPAQVMPQVVSAAQGQAVLIQMGLWTAVVDYVSSIADPTEKALAEVALYRTTEWRRDSPFLATAAVSLGLSSAQLDAMFVAADQVVF